MFRGGRRGAGRRSRPALVVDHTPARRTAGSWLPRGTQGPRPLDRGATACHCLDRSAGSACVSGEVAAASSCHL